MSDEGASNDLTHVVDSLPSKVLDEIKNILHNAARTPSGDYKFKAKTNNVSSPKTNILSMKTFLSYLFQHYHEDIINSDCSNVFNPQKLNDLIDFMYIRHGNDTNPDVDKKSLAGSGFLNWSSSIGSKIEQERSKKYWKLNKQDAIFLEYIKVACAGEGHDTKLIVYVKCSMTAETYVKVDPISNIRPNDLISKLSSVVGTDGKTNLLDQMEADYIDYIEGMYKNNKHQFNGCVFGALMTMDAEDNTEYCAYTFQDYLKAIIRGNYLNDIRLRLSKEPVTIHNNIKVPAFYHFNKKQLDAEGGSPHWDSWMQVIPETYHDVFKAWIYSIFDPNNKGRQALWLHSPGYDGKSQVTTAIHRYMKGCGVGSINSKVAASQFAFAAAYGKRLLIFGDCQNNRFLSTAAAHSILGGDLTPIEQKNKDVFTSRVFCKLLICSNKAPELDINASHEISRLIYIPLQLPSEEIQAKFLQTDDDGKVIYDSRNNPIHIGYKGEKGKELSDYLLDEMNAFLYKCRDSYLKLCPNYKEIIVGEEVREALYSACSSDSSEIYESYITKNYDFSQEIEGYENATDVSDRAVEHFNSVRMSKRFKEFKLSEFKSAFIKNAKRQLREAETPVSDYKIMRRKIDGNRVSIYQHVKYKGEDSAEGISLT